MFKNISIIGDGAMGTVLAMLLCEKNIPTRMWGYDREQLKQIESGRENKKFLPGYKLPETLVFESDDKPHNGRCRFNCIGCAVSIYAGDLEEAEKLFSQRMSQLSR